MNRLRTRRTATAATTVVALLALGAPAHAEVVVVQDGADATASLTDIRKVRIAHNEEQLKVRVNFPDLRKRANAGLTIYIDKNADRRGPEFGIGIPLFSGADYALARMKNWKFVEPPKFVECDYDVDLKWKRDVVIFRADRACFGDADELRVAMLMRDDHDSSHVVRDWMIDRREYTDWLAAG